MNLFKYLMWLLGGLTSFGLLLFATRQKPIQKMTGLSAGSTVRSSASIGQDIKKEIPKISIQLLVTEIWQYVKGLLPTNWLTRLSLFLKNALFNNWSARLRTWLKWFWAWLSIVLPVWFTDFLTNMSLTNVLLALNALLLLLILSYLVRKL